METLSKIVVKVTQHQTDIGDVLPSFPPHIQKAMRNTPYYARLAGYVHLYGIKRVLEFGTCTGASAICMAKYAEHVTTCDITNEHVAPSVKAAGNIANVVLPRDDIIDAVCVTHYDMIFVDIDHQGEEEQILHQKFIQNFSGIVFWDDVIVNESMQKFWESIEQEKLLTDWHNTGFGIVRY